MRRSNRLHPDTANGTPVNPADSINPPIRLLTRFQDVFPGHEPEILFRAAGREMWIAARLSDAEDRFTLTCVEAGPAVVTFTRLSARFKRTVPGRPLPRWARFPAGVALKLAEADIDARGIQAVVCGDEPPGPRYEYALCLAFAELWYALADRPQPPDALRQIADAVLRDYIESS